MQSPLTNTQQSPLTNTQQSTINTQLPTINAQQPSVNEILTDPRHQATRDAEILKTFELAKLTKDEIILVIHHLNNNQALQIALNKLKPFIHT